MTALFFDKRYDLARVGRYKFNYKLGIGARLEGKTAAETVVDPRTGEILAEEGQLIDRELAFRIENAGVLGVYVSVNENASALSATSLSMRHAISTLILLKSASTNMFTTPC